MLRILLPVHRSEISERAVDLFVQRIGWYAQAPEIHLLNVQPPLRGDVSAFVPGAQLEDFHRERGEDGLARAKSRLDAAGIAHMDHIMVGETAHVIARFAEEQGMDLIVLGARPGRFAGLLHGSVVARMLELASLPVLLLK